MKPRFGMTQAQNWGSNMKTTWYVLKNGKRWELWFEDDVCNERRLMSHYRTRKDAIALALSMSDIGDVVIC